jgi:D-inositol-3-phosphate glycosyltransferase
MDAGSNFLKHEESWVRMKIDSKRRSNLRETNAVRPPPISIAMISVHSSPVGRLGTQDTGGMSVYIRELSRQLGLGGHRVDIYTRVDNGHAPGEALRISENVRLIPLELGPGADAPKNALYPHLFAFYREMERFRRQEGIVYDLIHSHYWLSGLVGRRARQSWGIPHFTTFHTLGAVKNLVCGPASEPRVRMTAERELVAACDRVLVTSVREKKNLIRFYDTAADAIAVVPCGVDLNLFRPMDRAAARRRIGAAADEKLVLYVGRFAPEKGLERLLQAVAQLAHVSKLRLIVVGGDGERDATRRELMQLSRTGGIADRVVFRGRVDQAELPSYYSAADLLALPSSYESFGMVALEALACGTPVAATRVGAMEVLLQDAGNGRLAQDFRPAALAAAIEDLLKDRSAAPRRTERIRRSVARYDWPRVAADVLKVYRRGRADANEDMTEEPHANAGQAACCGCGALTPA